MKIINTLQEVYSRFGVWIQTIASLTLFVSSSFLDGPTGWVFFVISVIVLISDPVVMIVSGKGRSISRAYLVTVGLLALAIASFYIRSKFAVNVDTVADADDALAARLRKGVLAVFLFSYIAFFIYRLFICLGEASARSEGAADLNRKEFLNRSLLSILGALPLFALVNYIPYLRNPSIDLTPGFYSFGEASRTILKSVPVDVDVTVFLPDQQAMKDPSAAKTQPELFRISEDVRVLADQLPVVNSHFKLKFRNADLDLTANQEFGTVNNGTFVLRVLKTGVVTGTDKPYIERRVYVFNESDMERLERELVRAAIQVSTPERNIYFPASNGERWDYTMKAKTPGGIETLKDQLRFANYQLKQLDTQTGWPGPIPKDADAVVITGPTSPYGTEAKKAILDYLAGGGKVLAAADPSGDEDLTWLLEAADSSFRLNKGFMSNIPTLPGVIVSDSLESHRITENMNLAGRAIVVFPEAGYFQEKIANTNPPIFILQERNQKMKSSVFLYSPFNTILDVNRNGKKDPGENSGRFALGIAFEYPDHQGARLVVYSGVGWMTEMGLRFPIDQRNIVLAQDSVSFLLESPLAAALIPEQRKSRSIPVTDALKFRNILLGAILFPLLTAALTAFGVWFYRKRRGRKAQ